MSCARLVAICCTVLGLNLGSTCWQPAAAEKPLELWHAYRAKEADALEATVRRWNEGGRNGGPTIHVTPVPYDAFPDKITAAIPRGHGPDLFIFAHDRVGDWAESKVIEPIEFWMTEKHADQFLFKAIDALCYGDSLYGLPMAFKSSALYYNKQLVKTPPKNTDELLALGRQLTDAKAGRFGLVYDNAKLYFHAPWLFGFGGTIFDPNGKLSVATSAAAAALAFARELGKPGSIVPPEASSTLTTTLFNKGLAAMAISGPWMLAELADGVDFGVVPLPIVSATGKPAAPFMGAEGIMMSANCKRKEAAFRAMTFLTSDAMATIRATTARQPVANSASWDDPRVKQDRILSAFRRQLDAAQVMPGTPEMRLVWSPYDMALQKALGGSTTPENALAEAAAEIARYLAAVKRKPQDKR